MGAAAIPAAIMVAGTIYKGLGDKANLDSQANLARYNAEISELQGSDALRRGEVAAAAARMKGGAIESTQRTRYGASGVDPNVGSAASVQADTRMLAEYDAQVARNNAAREAWGYKAQAAGQRTQADLYRQAGDAAFLGSLIGAAGAGFQGMAGSKLTSATTAAPGTGVLTSGTGAR